MNLCTCKKGCKKEVKGTGLYALGHHPESNQGRLPKILRKLREKEKYINTQRGEYKSQKKKKEA